MVFVLIIKALGEAMYFTAAGLLKPTTVNAYRFLRHPKRTEKQSKKFV